MSADDVDVQELEREVSLLLRRARALSSDIAREVHPELDGMAYVLLRTVAEAGQLRASELAAVYGVDKSSISRQVRRLEDLGLLRRSSDTEDARALLLVLTEEGAGRLEHARRARTARLGGRLADWEPGEVAALAGLLRRFNDAYGDVPVPRG